MARRIESDPEELREIEDALSGAARPMHPLDAELLDTEEIDVLAIREALGDKACRSLRPREHILAEFGVPFSEESEVDCRHWDDPQGCR